MRNSLQDNLVSKRVKYPKNALVLTDLILVPAVIRINHGWGSVPLCFIHRCTQLIQFNSCYELQHIQNVLEEFFWMNLQLNLKK